MRTEVLKFSEESAQKAAEILKNGGIVAIPTETVYGLAANALDENAVRSIFAAKGRPQDNPLIVHISEIEMMKPLVRDVPELAKKLFEEAEVFLARTAYNDIQQNERCSRCYKRRIVNGCGENAQKRSCKGDYREMRISACSAFREHLGKAQPDSRRTRF